MPITPNGTISIQNIMTELDISGATSMNDADVRGLIDKVAGARMSMSEWYGAQSAFAFNLTSSVEANGTDLSTLATSAGWDGTVPIIMTVNSGIYIRSTSTTQPALTIDVAESEVINNGAIFGHGGGSGGGAGGHAIKINALSTIVTNNTGAFIAGGGGGGGGSGGGGGAGQSPYNQASSNGPTVGYLSHPGFVRTNGTASGGSCAITALGGTGGDQGGGGVTPATSYGSCSITSYGTFWPGGQGSFNVSGNVPNNAAAGGSVLSATSNTDGAGSNGGGGWGRTGENGGGVGGDAINTGYSYTYTNNGTVYGSV
jgi:hypothetical protein